MAGKVNRRTNAEWRALIAEQEASGQTLEEWCLAKDINFYTMRDRASRIRRLDQKGIVPIAAKKLKAPEDQAWVHVETPPMPVEVPEESDMQIGSLIIDFSEIRITADADYPTAALAALLRELALLC